MANLVITVTVGETDQKILKNDFVDFNEWVQSAVTAQIHKSWKRMQRTWTDKLMDDDTFTGSIPGNKEDFVALVLARSDYKDRAARDAAAAPPAKPVPTTITSINLLFAGLTTLISFLCFHFFLQLAKKRFKLQKSARLQLALFFCNLCKKVQKK